MRYRIPLSAFWILMLFRLTLAQEAVEKPLYQLTSNEATIMGTVTVTGAIPRPRRIDMAADPVCTEINSEPLLDDLVVKENNLQHAFVYVKSESLNRFRFAPPDTEVVLEHRNCYYTPRVLGVMVGQKLSFVNSDQTTHNTHPTPKSNPEFNMSSPPNSPPVTKTFPRQELFIPFKDNQHPWERAYVGVMAHPFFAVTDEFGRFQISGLPPGNYTLVVWHSQLGEQQLELTVTGREVRNADFTFDLDKKP